MAHSPLHLQFVWVASGPSKRGGEVTLILSGGKGCPLAGFDTGSRLGLVPGTSVRVGRMPSLHRCSCPRSLCVKQPLPDRGCLPSLSSRVLPRRSGRKILLLASMSRNRHHYEHASTGGLGASSTRATGTAGTGLAIPSLPLPTSSRS